MRVSLSSLLVALLVGHVYPWKHEGVEYMLCVGYECSVRTVPAFNQLLDPMRGRWEARKGEVLSDEKRKESGLFEEAVFLAAQKLKKLDKPGFESHMAEAMRIAKVNVKVSLTILGTRLSFSVTKIDPTKEYQEDPSGEPSTLSPFTQAPEVVNGELAELGEASPSMESTAAVPEEGVSEKSSGEKEVDPSVEPSKVAVEEEVVEYSKWKESQNVAIVDDVERVLSNFTGESGYEKVMNVSAVEPGSEVFLEKLPSGQYIQQFLLPDLGAISRLPTFLLSEDMSLLEPILMRNSLHPDEASEGFVNPIYVGGRGSSEDRTNEMKNCGEAKIEGLMEEIDDRFGKKRILGVIPPEFYCIGPLLGRYQFQVVIVKPAARSLEVLGVVKFQPRVDKPEGFLRKIWVNGGQASAFLREKLQEIDCFVARSRGEDHSAPRGQGEETTTGNPVDPEPLFRQWMKKIPLVIMAKINEAADSITKKEKDEFEFHFSTEAPGTAPAADQWTGGAIAKAAGIYILVTIALSSIVSLSLHLFVWTFLTSLIKLARRKDQVEPKVRKEKKATESPSSERLELGQGDFHPEDPEPSGTSENDVFNDGG